MEFVKEKNKTMTLAKPTNQLGPTRLRKMAATVVDLILPKLLSLYKSGSSKATQTLMNKLVI